MIRYSICLPILSALLLSGCVSIPAPAPSQTQLPLLQGEWTIKMIHSGGIMGLLRTIEISSDGSYVVMDERAGRTEQGQLSPEELASLVMRVSSMLYSAAAGPYSCADCFIYDIEIFGAEKPFTARVDDVTLEESGLGPLVTDLRAIIDRELD